MMESLQETGWLALEQQNDRVKQLVVLANVEQPNQEINSAIKILQVWIAILNKKSKQTIKSRFTH